MTWIGARGVPTPGRKLLPVIPAGCFAVDFSLSKFRDSLFLERASKTGGQTPRGNMRRHPSTKLSDAFNRRWLSYVAVGAAGISVLGPASVARAGIIYTSGPGLITGFESISIASNGMNNLTFVNLRFFSGGFGSGGNASVGAYPGNGVEIGPLNEGAVIGPGGKFGNGGTLAFGFKVYGSPGIESGPWVSVSDKFLGLQLTINGHTDYGWAELSVTENGVVPFLYVDEYAYNTVPGQAIAAGGGAITPEPGTLGLLALGAAGLALWRGRKVRLVRQGA